MYICRENERVIIKATPKWVEYFSMMILNPIQGSYFSKTVLFNIPFRGLRRKIQLQTAPKFPKGDLKLQPYRLTIF